MTIDADIVSSLGAHAGLSALIGSGGSQRLYPGRVPEDATYPCVVYQRVATDYEQTMGTGEPVVDERPVFQFSCYTSDRDTPLAAQSIAAQVQAAVLAMVGSSVQVFSRQIIARRDFPEPVGQRQRVDLDVMWVHS